MALVVDLDVFYEYIPEEEHALEPNTLDIAHDAREWVWRVLSRIRFMSARGLRGATLRNTIMLADQMVSHIEASNARFGNEEPGRRIDVYRHVTQHAREILAGLVGDGVLRTRDLAAEIENA